MNVWLLNMYYHLTFKNILSNRVSNKITRIGLTALVDDNVTSRAIIDTVIFLCLTAILQRRHTVLTFRHLYRLSLQNMADKHLKCSFCSWNCISIITWVMRVVSEVYTCSIGSGRFRTSKIKAVFTLVDFLGIILSRTMEQMLHYILDLFLGILLAHEF